MRHPCRIPAASTSSTNTGFLLKVQPMKAAYPDRSPSDGAAYPYPGLLPPACTSVGAQRAAPDLCRAAKPSLVPGSNADSGSEEKLDARKAAYRLIP